MKLQNLKKLTDAVFKGEFYRNPEAVAREVEVLKKHPEFYMKEEAAAIQRDAKPFEFDLKIFTYNSDSGLFIAESSDAFGGSGIVGIIRNEKIQFNKIYVNERFELSNRKPNFERNFGIVQYFGNVALSNGILSAKGQYLIEGYNELMGGFWEMHSIGD